jgi:hypothetical protein
MDINKIFDLFNQNNSLKNEDATIIDLHRHPLFWVGMFEKIIKNNNILKIKLSEFLLSDDYDIKELNKLGDSIIFNKAYMFIKNIDLNNPEHQKIIITRGEYGLLPIISLAIDYFLIQEEYEKCTF